ncbi:hypothetical protein TSAR_002905 [Trichomalopsis sarcophagae]|uniref:Uncharacterized protein n=1 Tax=Trichomalopsis sarcophagae TaxID=543379 RepID=A0A232F758_9HYME|nr:hypothetical protein TSAR_002905 [Trichomalopsis sarcophagae]
MLIITDISVDLGDKEYEKIVNDQEVSHHGRQMTNQILHVRILSILFFENSQIQFAFVQHFFCQRTNR